MKNLSTFELTEVLANKFTAEVNEVLKGYDDIDQLRPRDFIGQFEQLIETYGFEKVEKATNSSLAGKIVSDLGWEGFQHLSAGEPPLSNWYKPKMG